MNPGPGRCRCCDAAHGPGPARGARLGGHVDSPVVFSAFHPRRRTVLALSAASLLTLVGCSEQDEEEAPPEIEVSGEFGTVPQITFEAPLEVGEPYTEEVISGDGAELTDDSAVMLAYRAVDATTGETVEQNFQNPPQVLLLSPDSAGLLYDELLGRREGTRLLRVEQGTEDRPTPLVLVYDILRTSAWGEELEPPQDGPQVSVGEDGEPEVQIPDEDPPAELQVVPLIRGEGPQVRSGQAVTVRYSTVSWSTGEVVDTLWGEGVMPTTIPFTGLIPGWQNGLVDEQVGSRVMLVTPPEQAYGTDTLVFVIDVLAVSSVQDEEGEA